MQSLRNLFQDRLAGLPKVFSSAPRWTVAKPGEIGYNSSRQSSVIRGKEKNDMTGPITFAICGCGSRGLEAYASYQKIHPEKMKIVAGADNRPGRLALLREWYGVSEDMCFASDEELLAQPKLADVMLIATQDRQHVPAALKALEKGYHVLLEKPVSPDLGECLQLQRKAKETGLTVVVCHVLRYTQFYSTIKALLDRGELGKLETIDATEHVAYWHQAHSFVRGNWRRADETSPMILAKSCHDMDILRWLAGEKCLRVQSFGSLDHFRPECAPQGAGERCLVDCACKDGCIYDAEKIYITGKRCGIRNGKKGWPNSVVTGGPPTEESLREALRTGPYGRCVYRCDNDVVDHQTVNMAFANNIYATFTMTAFTETSRRTIKITGTLGELEGDLETEKLILRPFGQPERVIELGDVGSEFAGHGGGDAGLAGQFCDLIASGSTDALTSIDVSIESHVMALAAEASRLRNGETIELDEFTRTCQ